MSVSPGQSQERTTSAPPHPPLSRRLLALTIIGGVLGLLAIGALADLFAVTPLHPPIHAAASQQAGLDTIILTINPEPLTAGQPTAFVLDVRDATGAHITQASLLCAFSAPGYGATLSRAARGDGASGYTCDATLPAAGAWSLTVTLNAPGAPAAQTTFALQAR